MSCTPPDMPRPTHPECWLGGYEPYGVVSNRVTADQLFDRYEACGFLYPEKQARLAPFIDSVKHTWNASMMLNTPACVHHCLHASDQWGRAWAAVSLWRSSRKRVHSQHLVSTGRPGLSRSVLLAAQDFLNSLGVEVIENWFRAENRYPNRVFGSAPDRLGDANSAVERRRLLAAGRASGPSLDFPGRSPRSWG